MVDESEAAVAEAIARGGNAASANVRERPDGPGSPQGASEINQPSTSTSSRRVADGSEPPAAPPAPSAAVPSDGDVEDGADDVLQAFGRGHGPGAWAQKTSRSSQCI